MPPTEAALIRRFGPTERTLHWVHAAGFLAMLATGLVLVAVTLSEKPRKRLAEARAARYEAPAMPGGLMSGFFEVPAPRSSGVWTELDADTSGDRARA